ncbi:MAG: ABC transporter ATP-binding protein [Acidobacteria bacterium]|nr:ABC transporter ATP-binding protein [Acidobacteriota bacterium]
MATTVLVRDLRKAYGTTRAADGVSFEIVDGEIFGLLGPNGAGKTTTIECVIGLRQPDSGLIEVCGIDARRQPQEIKQRIGAALQSVALQDQITPREALAVFGAFYRRRLDPAALLERFGLTAKADAYFSTLSGGQRQRLALALAFVNAPDLVFLDEPTAGLDVEVRRELRGEILRMRADGHTVLLTTHDIEEAEALCDRIAIIDHGRVVATGTPGDLIARSTGTTAVTVVTTSPVPGGVLTSIGGAHDVNQRDGRLTFAAANVTRALADLVPRLSAAGIEIVELHAEKATLEDVLLQVTASAHAATQAETAER